MKKIVFSIVISLLALGVNAQNEDDALRYSMTYFGGTSRNMSMAGAFSALGGDYSTVLQNPAGLGRFKRDNFSFTANVENPSSSSSYYGNPDADRGTVANISNISYVNVYSLNPKKFNNWYGVQLGLGYNRVKSFQERIQYSGEADSSILHSFINEANGTNQENIYDAFPFTAGLAFDTYAIDPGPNNTYVTDFTSGKVIQNRSITRKGGMGEYNFSLSGNYANKLLLGGSFNFIKVNYSENFEHNESFSDTSLWLQSIRYTGDLDINGWGYNARFGAIFFPTEWIRFGMAIQTPTVLYMKDNWTNNMSSGTADGPKTVDDQFVPYGQYDYKVKTPFRANTSIGIVIKKFGSVGVEVEYVDYGQSKLSSKKFSEAPYSFNTENAQIENIYRSVFNYKIGVEARITSQLYLRGGYAYYSSPFKTSSGNIQYPTQFITGGLGYNFGKIYLDVAYVLRKSTEDYYAYDPTVNGSKARINFSNAQYVFSIGYRIK